MDAFKEEEGGYQADSFMHFILFARPVDIKLRRKVLTALLEFIELGIKYPNLILKIYY